MSILHPPSDCKAISFIILENQSVLTVFSRSDEQITFYQNFTKEEHTNSDAFSLILFFVCHGLQCQLLPPSFYPSIKAFFDKKKK